MGKLQYSFTTKFLFTEEVRSHSFLLRCTPQHLPFQKIISEQCVIFPSTELSRGMDSFGNIVHSGHITEPHSTFEFCSEGEVWLETYRICEELNPLFLYTSDYTKPLNLVEQLFLNIEFSHIDTISQKIEKISAKLHENFFYETGATTIATTANHALEIGKGVCQDYAHIMTALCRKANIPTRYVAGFMQGEGYTHAWIEFYEHGIWLPFDPTHNRWIEDGYIKLAHGRDYADCPIERGVFSGVTFQTLNVNLRVEGIEQ
ncbi:MAG: transglutaminase family protein [Bacteroidales bacterium]|nr:transglutaminase family protein [Bacteroidales bacterium]